MISCKLFGGHFLIYILSHNMDGVEMHKYYGETASAVKCRRCAITRSIFDL